MLFLLFIVIFIFLAVLISWFQLIWDAKSVSVRGPFPFPIIGNGQYFLGDSSIMVKSFELLTKQYGSIVRFYILSQRYFLISEPKIVEALTSSTELLSKGRSYNFLHPWLGQGLLTSSGQRWKNHRKFLTPAFHFNILQNFLPVFEKNGKILIKKLRTKCANGQPIDMFPIIALTALDNVTESIMGVSINAQTDSESQYVQAIKDMANVTAYRMRNIFASIDPIFNFMEYKKLQDKALKILHGQSYEVIATRRQQLRDDNKENDHNKDLEYGIKNKYAFLDLLLLAEINGQKIDDVSIREEVDTFMFEGHDTTTSGIVFSLYCIANHPQVQKRIVDELKSLLGDDLKKDPSYSDIQQMKYLETAIRESLRLYPSVPYFERDISKDTDLGGVYVPKGTSILVDVMNMQRNPKYFEDPLQFRPERFDDSNRHPFSWLAFSAGPRNCIGQKFAMVSMKSAISAIIRNFKLFPGGPDPILKSDLVLSSCNGVHISMEKR